MLSFPETGIRVDGALPMSLGERNDHDARFLKEPQQQPGGVLFEAVGENDPRFGRGGGPDCGQLRLGDLRQERLRILLVEKNGQKSGAVYDQTPPSL
jgi:hypothetical protein